MAAFDPKEHWGFLETIDARGGQNKFRGEERQEAMMFEGRQWLGRDGAPLDVLVRLRLAAPIGLPEQTTSCWRFQMEAKDLSRSNRGPLY
jgi:hypothetical protein